MSTAKKSAPVVRAIPLNKLKKSPKNVRVTPHTPEEIAALADNIHETRMLQMPVVEPECSESGKPTGFYLVNIGEGRRKAQLLRVKRRQIKKDEPILCVVDASSDGKAISLAENIIRTAMHPADQYVAFRDLVDAGRSVEEVAAQFSIAPIVVARRLKLANVHPSFLDLFRAGSIKLDQVMALTLTDDHQRQQEVWNQLAEWNRHPDVIRRALTEHEIAVDEPIARFVGIDAYTAAGGGIRRDLFAADENSGYITDAALLNRLADEKLKQKAERIKKEGHAWVDTTPNLDYADLRSFGRVSSVLREPTTKEQKKLAAIATKRSTLEPKLEAAEAAENDELVDELTAEGDDLDAEEDKLKEAMTIPDPAQQAAAGAVVTIDEHGKLRVERGLLRPEDAKRLARGKKAESRETDDAPRTHSESMVRRLTAHRTLALQAVLAQRPDVALIAMTHKLAERTFYRIDQHTSLLRISADDVELRQHAADIEQSKAHAALEAQRETLQRKLPKSCGDLFAWLLDQPQAEVLALLAFCVAISVQAVQSDEGENEAEALARAVALDMREWWTPTADAYLSSLPKARILSVVTEAVSAEAAVPLEKLKKAPLAEAAAAQIVGTGWLPEPLRAAAAA